MKAGAYRKLEEPYKPSGRWGCLIGDKRQSPLWSSRPAVALSGWVAHHSDLAFLPLQCSGLQCSTSMVLVRRGVARHGAALLGVERRGEGL